MEIIVALDFSSQEEIIDIATKLDPSMCFVKVGLEGFILGGPQLIDELHKMGHRIFLDLKLDDIPETIRRAVNQICSLGVWGTTVHTKTGPEGMAAAFRASDESENRVYLFGVTVLTSMNEEDMYDIGIDHMFTLKQYVMRLADMAWNKPCYFDGIVCSVHEAPYIKQISQDILVISPGIRMKRCQDDQKRVATIDKAINNGVDFAVIGREITRAEDPAEALNNFYKECE